MPEQNPASLTMQKSALMLSDGHCNGPSSGRCNVAGMSCRNRGTDLAGLGVKGFFGWP
jgi:hypothetical protein